MKVETEDFRMAMASQGWRKGKDTLMVAIADHPGNALSPAGAPGLLGGRMEMSAQGASFRSFELDGLPALESFDSRSRQYTLMVQVAGRFVVTIGGMGIDPELGRELWRQLDHRKLASMR